MKQTISILVENQAGVLNRITSLFSRRAFNIDSLAVGVTDDPTLSRITIIVDNGNSVVEQVEKQLNKLVEVIKVRTLDQSALTGRELMLIKVSANKTNREHIMTICNICGAKVADKLNVISNLLEKCDTLIIGGGMAYTFLKAKGYEVGTSLLDEEKIDYCKQMMEKAAKSGKELVLPVDTVVTTHFPEPIDAAIETQIVPSDKIPADKMGMDIGEKTRKLYAEKIASAKAVIWNGPMGVFENPTLAKGTMAVAQALSDVYGKCTTIIGGGDSAAAVQQLGFADRVTHISTGGGASLELFEGKVLPGIACLNDK